MLNYEALERLKRYAHMEMGKGVSYLAWELGKGKREGRLIGKWGDF